MTKHRFLSALLAVCLLVLLVTPRAAAANSVVERQIFEYVTQRMGLNSAAACGILANIEAESGFELGAYGDGGTSFGLCQWHNSRFTALRTYCGQQGLDYWTLDGQLSYLFFELRTHYAGTYATLRAVPNTQEGAYYAAYYMCVNFEAPAGAEVSGANRGRTAQFKFWSRYGGPTEIDSLGYSGLKPGIGGSTSVTFYWEKGDDTPEDTPPAFAPSNPPTYTPSTPGLPSDPVPDETQAPIAPDPGTAPDPTEPSGTAEPTTAAEPGTTQEPSTGTQSTEPASSGTSENPEPKPTGSRFHYVPHHRPPVHTSAAAVSLSPWCLCFFTAGCPRKRELLLPEREDAEEPIPELPEDPEWETPEEAAL